MPVGMASSARLLASKPSSPKVGSGAGVPLRGGARLAACGSISSGARQPGSARIFFSQAFLYGV